MTTLPALPEGLTAVDIADALHRRQLTDPTFDPIETARERARAACANLLDAVAYLEGETNREHTARLLAKLVNEDTPPGDARLMEYLRLLTNWFDAFLDDATSPEVTR